MCVYLSHKQHYYVVYSVKREKHSKINNHFMDNAMKKFLKLYACMRLLWVLNVLWSPYVKALPPFSQSVVLLGNSVTFGKITCLNHCSIVKEIPRPKHLFFFKKKAVNWGVWEWVHCHHMVGSMSAGRCCTGEVAEIYTLIHRQLAEGDTVPGTGFGNLKVHPSDTLFPIKPPLLQ